MSNRVSQNLLPLIPGGDQPVILRSRYVRRLVDQVNQNTINIAPPRAVRDTAAADELARAGTFGDVDTQTDVPSGDDSPDFGERVVMEELSRSTSTVRVTNPDDESQFVDVERIEQVLMLGSDGIVYEMRFNNTQG